MMDATKDLYAAPKAIAQKKSHERIDLADLKFSAKIDYITLRGVCLPGPEGLKGTCKWPRKLHGHTLTLHDPSPEDLVALHSHFPDATVVEMEVSIDVSPSAEMREAARAKFLASVKAEIFAKRLMPSIPKGMTSSFRGTYIPRPNGYALQPFNLRVPGVDEQHLHGLRHDGVQVKVYYKRRDARKPLDWKQHVIRVEVRLGFSGVLHHQLDHVGDLLEFAFRKELTPYFRLVRGTLRASTRKRKPVAPLLRVLDARMQQYDDEHWKTVGIGAFLKGGKRNTSGVRFLRDQELNERIGQALHRLQRQISKMKFVRERQAANDGDPAIMRVAA